MSFEQFESCFLGVSLENKNFTPEKLKALAEWISRRFKYCVVLVGDSIHRITLETTKSVQPEISLIEGLKMGSSFIEENENIFHDFPGKTQFTFETCSQIQESEDYKQFYQYLRDFFESDPNFRSSVESFGRKYHSRKTTNLDDILLKERIRRSCEYFLEEFAIFACLQKRGLSVMVYPGTFSTLTEIVNGEYPYLFKEIKELIVVSLHFKTR
ncbi:MAG: tRNA-dependent cyclodipeptide synthase [Sphaerospermopsis sp. SIO1G2]|nr:tRNA-dependent cyclodipeptide synthase [Sphaerospermopsis sp. SIO1G2]